MSGDRLSAEREQEIRDMLSDPWTAELLAELDAVRADLAQARKERHAIFEASRELAAQCNAAEAALAQARKERDEESEGLEKWHEAARILGGKLSEAEAALAAARESLETRSLLLAAASKGLALAQKFGDALALELCYAEKAESERLESEQALSDWRELWEGQSNEWKERHHHARQIARDALRAELEHRRER